MKYSVILFIITLLLPWPCRAEESPQPPKTLADIHYLTEEYYPFNFTEKGEPKGISVDLLRMIWDELEVPHQPIMSLPWARAYQQVQQDRNTVLFCMGRDPKREDLFLWAGPVVVVRFVLIAKKESHITLNTLNGLEGYRIGTLRDDISDILLKSYKSITKVDQVASMDSNVDKLMSGRLDMVAYEEGAWRRLAVKHHLSPDDFETIYTLSQTEVYYAFHRDTPIRLVQEFQRGLDVVKARPAYDDVIAKYLH